MKNLLIFSIYVFVKRYEKLFLKIKMGLPILMDWHYSIVMEELKKCTTLQRVRII
jgi:cobalamin biosynthesis Co2+ chelatase CbiK